MFLTLAALLLQISPVQPLNNPRTPIEQPSVVASATGNAAEAAPAAPRLVAMEYDLPFAEMSARPGLTVLLSTPKDGPEASSSSLPAHPNPAFRPAAVNSSTRVGSTHATPMMISVVELQAEVRRKKRIWFTLAAAQHGAAAFDAWSTRRSLANGGRELNPLMKPFAHSNAIYAATQVGPVLFDYLGKRMMMSRNPMLRRMWWLPQVAGTAASLFSGVHNLGVHGPAQP
jgi:hypothetical protein